MSEKGRTALITGASEGIGRELARIMAADGWNLVLVARREDLLANLATSLIVEYNVKCAVIAADLADPKIVPKITEKLSERKVAIDALINNAGFGQYGLFAKVDDAPFRSMVEVNITALIGLTRALLPEMIERGRGRVMNVASTAAFQPIPTNAIYGATKAFVLSFSEALATELTGTGVTVTCLCPGVTRTGFARVAGASHLDTDFRGAMSAEEVARQGYDAMMAGKRTIVTGRVNAFLAFCTRLVPRSLAANIAYRLMKKRRV